MLSPSARRCVDIENSNMGSKRKSKTKNENGSEQRNIRSLGRPRHVLLLAYRKSFRFVGDYHHHHDHQDHHRHHHLEVQIDCAGNDSAFLMVILV